MYRVVLCAFVVALVSADLDDAMIKKCAPLLHPRTMACCKKARLPKDMEKMDFSECDGLPMNPIKCEFDKCMAKSIGLASDDGSVDMKGVQKHTEKILADEPEVAGAIIAQCVNGDYKKYGPPDFCDVIKMRNCIHSQFVMQCPEFSSEGECSKTKALVEECTAAFA